MTPLDMRDPAYRQNPYPILAELREHDPVHRDSMGIWCVTRHADVQSLNRDPRLGRDLRKWIGYPMMRPYLADSPLERCAEQWMFSLDPPDHTRLRRLVARAFTPRAIQAMRRDIEGVADALISELPASGEIDLMTAFARSFPIRVIARILGLPEGASDELRDWSNRVAQILEPTARKSHRLAANEAAIAFGAYLRERVAERETHRADSVMSMLVAAAEDGDRLTEDELVAQLVMLFIAGHETTTNLIGNGMLALARHPDQMRRLRDDVSLAPSAVEEMLRYESPANTNARAVHENIEVCGTVIEAGQLLLCMLGAANRDPRAFPNPDAFDIGRNPNPHVSFGGGVHFCVGAPLARMEGEIAIRRLLDKFASIEVVEERVRWRDLINLRGLETLPLAVR